jgi:hypothetical protein
MQERGKFIEKLDKEDIHFFDKVTIIPNNHLGQQPFCSHISHAD